MLYSNIKHCESNTVNEKNQRKQNKLRGIKEDLQRLFGQVHDGESV